MTQALIHVGESFGFYPQQKKKKKIKKFLTRKKKKKTLSGKI